MNIFTADFNLISFLIILFAIGMGAYRSNKNVKHAEAPKNPQDFDDNDNQETAPIVIETNEEEIIINCNINGKDTESEIKDVTSKSSQNNNCKVNDNNVKDSNKKGISESDENSDFNLRQAIISYEILNHPHF